LSTAEVETKLVTETSSKNIAPTESQPPMFSIQPDWNSFPLDMNNVDINMDMDFGGDDVVIDDVLLNSNFAMPQADFAFVGDMPDSGFFSQEVISLGLQEPLPPDDMVEELYAYCYALKLSLTSIGTEFTLTNSTPLCL
jgi:hypothetical protein